MKVIGHQAIGVDLPACFLASLAQGLEKSTTVVIILKDGLAAVAPIHDVVDGTGLLNSQFAPFPPPSRRRAGCGYPIASQIREPRIGSWAC